MPSEFFFPLEVVSSSESSVSFGSGSSGRGLWFVGDVGPGDFSRMGGIIQWFFVAHVCNFFAVLLLVG